MLLLEPIELLIGGELGVEDQMLRRLAMLTRPKPDEAEDLLGLFALADIGVRIAEDLAIGILGQEGENARLSATSLG